MAYTTINKSTDYFNTLLYTDNGANRTLTGVGFQPDWVWIKTRNHGNSHNIFDAVRGANKNIRSNSTAAEVTTTDTLTAFTSDGFSLGVDASGYGVNYDNKNEVSWNWKAGGGAGSSNTDGDITSTVSASTTSGFSIVKWTGNGSSATIGHGLGVAPKVMITRRYDGAYNWFTYHDGIGNGKYLLLEATDAQATASGSWNNTSPTSSVFTKGSGANTNGGSYIAYCFAEKKGFSKFGSYTGNGTNLFVYTGFKPAFMMCKKTDSADNWKIVDNKRSPINVMDDTLAADTSNAEASPEGGVTIDFLSNGFAFKSMSNAAFNANGGSYIYMAFAEAPLVGTNNVPCTAR